MKKLVIFSMFLIVLANFTGCERNENKMIKPNIKTSSGIYENKEWDDMEFPVNVDCVPDADTAISIASSILFNIQEDGKYPDYSPQSVFYDTQDQIWIVSFYPNSSGYIGANLNFAINKTNAQIVKIWVEE